MQRSSSSYACSFTSCGFSGLGSQRVVQRGFSTQYEPIHQFHKIELLLIFSAYSRDDADRERFTRRSKNAVKERANRRFWYFGGIGIFTALALYSLLNEFEEFMMFYMTPTQVFESSPAISPTRKFRLGGDVVKGSIKSTPGTLDIRFLITDHNMEMPVSYSGVVPDLFREGQGAVVEGYLNEDGSFRATSVLAKHDEKYMPREVADMLEIRKKEQEAHSAVAPV